VLERLDNYVRTFDVPLVEGRNLRAGLQRKAGMA
jgi:hypothetical protein